MSLMYVKSMITYTFQTRLYKHGISGRHHVHSRRHALNYTIAWQLHSSLRLYFAETEQYHCVNIKYQQNTPAHDCNGIVAKSNVQASVCSSAGTMTAIPCTALSTVLNFFSFGRRYWSVTRRTKPSPLGCTSITRPSRYEDLTFDLYLMRHTSFNFTLRCLCCHL